MTRVKFQKYSRGAPLIPSAFTIKIALDVFFICRSKKNYYLGMSDEGLPSLDCLPRLQSRYCRSGMNGNILTQTSQRYRNIKLLNPSSDVLDFYFKELVVNRIELWLTILSQIICVLYYIMSVKIPA